MLRTILREFLDQLRLALIPTGSGYHKLYQLRPEKTAVLTSNGKLELPGIDYGTTVLKPSAHARSIKFIHAWTTGDEAETSTSS
ncbi:hypothetical protein N7488_004779 [Penicillium malachiteum]|nr:hypothetical protein N7488_004779 [Penicillium malachiteum]